VFSRDRGGDVWLTWFKNEDSAIRRVRSGRDAAAGRRAVTAPAERAPIGVERTDRYPVMVEVICEFQPVGTTGFEPATS